jgi:DNA-binding transcriptional MerR regulator
MGQSAVRPRVLYLDANDTIEEIGITRRQLKYWEDKDLLEPELGKGSGRYTDKDLGQLRMIKRLIVDEHFPLEFTKRLLGGNLLGEVDGDDFVEANQRSYLNRLLDIDTGEVLTREEMFKRLWGEFGATANAEQVEEHFYQLALLLFRMIRGQPRNADYFNRRRDDISERLSELEDVARVEGEYDDRDPRSPYPSGLRLDPIARGEPPANRAELLANFKEHYSKLEPFADARRTMVMRGRQPVPSSDRFFDEDLIEMVDGR